MIAVWAINKPPTSEFVLLKKLLLRSYLWTDKHARGTDPVSRERNKFTASFALYSHVLMLLCRFSLGISLIN